MLETFYSTGAQICFALLGLWWVVVQFKYTELMRDATRRRTAYNISLYFILPGAMSLLSLLAAEVTILWRIAFAAAGAIGVFEALVMLRNKDAGSMGRIARGATLALYVLIVIFALAPEIPRSVGVPPLVVEGILLALLVLTGIQFAWNFFTANES